MKKTDLKVRLVVVGGIPTARFDHDALRKLSVVDIQREFAEKQGARAKELPLGRAGAVREKA